jgi:dienelactone hydrolase
MGSRWKNKGQGGGVSWGNKDRKIAQQKKPKAPGKAQAAAAQTAKANLAAAQPARGESDKRGRRVLPSSSGLSTQLTEDAGLQRRLWRIADGAERPPRLLCLHGYTQTGALLKRKLAALEKSVQGRWPGAQFTYPTAPHTAKAEWVDAEDGDAYAKAWWLQEEEEEAGSPGGGSGSSRSRPRYEGWEASWELLEEVASRSGPFDAVLGFSQGAALAALLCCRWRLRCCIAIGGYLAEGHPLQSGGGGGGQQRLVLAAGHKPQTLHVIGEVDQVVTAAASEELAAAYRQAAAAAAAEGGGSSSSSTVLLHYHQGGHAIPNTEEFREAVLALLQGPSAADVVGAPPSPPPLAPAKEGGAPSSSEARASREARVTQLRADAPCARHFHL